MNFKRISVQDSAAIIEQSTLCHIVDIRDPSSFQTGHIPHATLLDNNAVQSFIANTDKKAPLLVCCYHGNSSQQAADFLASQGFEDVYSIDGGFEAWKLSQAVEA